MSNFNENQGTFSPFRIDVGTQSVSYDTPLAYLPGHSYDAVKPSRHKRDRKNLGGSGDEHVCKRDLFELLDINLDLDRNNTLSIRMIDVGTEQITGDCGFVLGSQAEGDALQKQIENDWWEWLTWVCDPAGEQHGITRFYNMERQKHLLGGSFIQWDDLGGDGEGQFIIPETTRCLTPYDATGRAGDNINGYPMVHGIARDKRTKKAQWYWFADEVPTSFNVSVRDGRSYPADSIIHYYTPSRESLTRGVPVNTPVLNTYDNIDDVFFFETLGIKAAAARSLNVETEAPAATAAYEQYLAQQSGNYDPGQQIEEWVPGSVTYTRKGEKITVLESKRPSNEVQEFIVKLIRTVGLPLAVPYEWLLLDFSKINLGSLRVLMQVIQQTWRRHQFNHGYVLSRLFRMWMQRQIARRRYPNRPDLFQHVWSPPTWKSPQPVQDATANKIAIEGGWGSEEDAAAQNGKDIERVQQQRERYMKWAKKNLATAPTQPGPKVDKNGNPDQSGGTP